jgi:L-fuculose-phosphate aldolase
MKSERHHRAEIVRFGRMIHELGYVAATDGNLSVRLGPNRVLATPTSMSKGRMQAKDMVVVDMSGRKVSGPRNVSSEIAMHLLIYKLRPDVNAIVHAHPPTATGFAAAGMALDQALCSEVVITLGSIPLARYGCPGTKELLDGLEPLIPRHDAILMANHGVVTYGENLLHAYMNMETVEHFARVALVVHQLGRQQLLSGEDVNKLMAAREKYEATRNSALATKSGNGGNGAAERRGRAVRRQA